MHNKKRHELYFVTILISIDKVNRNIKDISYKEFISDEIVFGFIIRNLQEIGESVKKLIDVYDLENKHPNEGDWRKIVDFRNVVVHKYFGSDPEIIFAIATKEIPVFEKQILKVLQKIEDKFYLLQATEMTIPIYEKMQRKDTVDFLKTLFNQLKKSQH